MNHLQKRAAIISFLEDALKLQSRSKTDQLRTSSSERSTKRVAGNSAVLSGTRAVSPSWLFT